MNNNGFTLIELIVVIAIIAILSAIAVPRFSGYTDVAKEQVCNSNCKTIERAYEAYLVLEKLEHTDVLFNQYLVENNYGPCPEGGSISYVEDEVHCSIHSTEVEEEEIPFL
jgi:prepilin-type N-terminal cleavage/methylation domain-containing protein